MLGCEGESQEKAWVTGQFGLKPYLGSGVALGHPHTMLPLIPVTLHSVRRKRNLSKESNSWTLRPKLGSWPIYRR